MVFHKPDRPAILLAVRGTGCRYGWARQAMSL